MRRRLLSAAALTLLAARPVCAAPPAPGAFKDYNLVIISLGNVGAGHMSLYGYGRRTTPLLDRWAEGALVFEDYSAPASWTLPTAASLFTGLYPETHGLTNRYSERVLDRSIKTLPELLRDAGYRTAAYTGGLDYARTFSTMRGFGTVSNNLNLSGFGLTLPQASAWLKKNSREKFFLFLHGYDAHCPFTPPLETKGTFSGPGAGSANIDTGLCIRGNWRSKKDRFEAWYTGGCTKTPRPAPCAKGTRSVFITSADVQLLQDLYDEEILALDQKVGAFLASLDKALLARTVVVVLGDHGEMFAKHGRFGRAGSVRGTLYEDVVRVPLLLRLPGRRGGRIKGLAQTVDLLPTLARLLGLKVPHSHQGIDLALALDGAPSPRTAAFAGLTFYEGFPPYAPQSAARSVRQGGWKLIHETVFPKTLLKRLRLRLLFLLGRAEAPQTEAYELYNLAKDPEELDNLAEKEPAHKARLAALLESWERSARTPPGPRQLTRPLPEHLVKEARENGYW